MCGRERYDPITLLGSRKICFLFLTFLLAVAYGELNVSRALTTAGTDSDSDSSGSDRVYLRSITALVFSENGRAASRKGARKQELRCVGGSASGFWWFSDYYPHQVTCRNIGWDGASIQWSCKGNLNDFVEFGPDTEVKCEPYDEDQTDGYVVSGSCRLEYTLNFTKFHITFVHVVYGTYLIARHCVLSNILETSFLTLLSLKHHFTN